MLSRKGTVQMNLSQSNLTRKAKPQAITFQPDVSKKAYNHEVKRNKSAHYNRKMTQIQVGKVSLSKQKSQSSQSSTKSRFMNRR